MNCVSIGRWRLGMRTNIFAAPRSLITPVLVSFLQDVEKRPKTGCSPKRQSVTSKAVLQAQMVCTVQKLTVGRWISWAIKCAVFTHSQSLEWMTLTAVNPSRREFETCICYLWVSSLYSFFILFSLVLVCHNLQAAVSLFTVCGAAA